jgi:hypothetical protein
MDGDRIDNCRTIKRVAAAEVTNRSPIRQRVAGRSDQGSAIDKGQPDRVVAVGERD